MSEFLRTMLVSADCAQRLRTAVVMTTKHRTSMAPAVVAGIACDEADLLAFQAGAAGHERYPEGDGPPPNAVIVIGDAAFAAFADRHRGVFVRRARALGTPHADLEDVLQEVLIHVMKRALLWRPGGRSPLNWVCEYLDWAIGAAQRGASTIKRPRSGTAPRAVAWPDGFDPSDTADPAIEACDTELVRSLRSYHAQMVKAVETLNETLRGSPYLLDSGEQGAKRAKFLLEESLLIEQRERDVEARLQTQAADIRDRLALIVEARSVFESNALELTGLPLSETETAIEEAPQELDALRAYVAQRAVTGDRHLVDVLGLHQANLFARTLARDFAEKDRPLREVDIRTLHQITVPSEDFAGEYRGDRVEISGSDHVPPHFSDVPRQMSELVEWLNATTSLPPLAACVVHSWLTIIHPFKDGNGRIARLLANIVLLRAGWPSLVVRSSDRLQYLDALSASDEGGNLLPLFDLFIKTLRYSLDELEKPGLAERLFGIDLRKRPDQRYTLWSRQLTEFLDALRSSLKPHGFVLDRLAVPQASTMMLLEERSPAGNTWLAKVRHPDGHDFLLWLGFMSTEMLDGSQLDRGHPSIFISKRDRRPDALKPYTNNLRDGSPVEIDEISLVPDLGRHEAFVRRRTYVSDEPIVDAARDLAHAFAQSLD